jgi:hypothetical protein
MRDDKARRRARPPGGSAWRSVDVEVLLASATARSYLASRTELTANDVAVTIIDDENRFCFVVATRISFRRVRR